MSTLTAAQRVAIARHPQRPNITDYIEALFTDFFEQKGDRLCGEDAAILGGVALFHGRPVTVIGTRKGKTLEENLKCNFGMPNPEGYRKALRLMRQAEKFRRPILTFIDTSGAYPGLEAEARGQGEAIARNLMEMSRLTVPVIALITGEGNSGGALALGVANRVLMLENSVYAILSPEGFASILWKDSQRHEEACELMKLTATDLLALGVAGWMRYVGGVDEQGNPIEISDPLLPVIQKAVQSSAEGKARVQSLLAIKAIFGDDLPDNSLFTAKVTEAYLSLLAHGAKATVAKYSVK